MVVESREKRPNRAVPVRFAPNPVRFCNPLSFNGLENCTGIGHCPWTGVERAAIFFHTHNRFYTLNLAGPVLAPDGFQGADDLAQSRGGLNRREDRENEVSVLAGAGLERFERLANRP